MSHSAVPNRLKVLPVIAFIYMIFPRDLFIDFHPFGLADDLVAVSVLLSIFINKSWKYVDKQKLEKSDEILSSLFDLRLPLTFSIEDCEHLSEIIVACSEHFLKN